MTPKNSDIMHIRPNGQVMFPMSKQQLATRAQDSGAQWQAKVATPCEGLARRPGCASVRQWHILSEFKKE